MAASKPKQGGGSYKHFVPHIVRAILNPFTFVRMSRAYFASLLDINYMKEVSVILYGGGRVAVLSCVLMLQ